MATNLNASWDSKQTPAKPANLMNLVYTDLGMEHLTEADVAIFSFIVKEQIKYNPNGIIRSVIGFTFPYVKQPVLGGNHLITRVYNTPAKKTYHLKGHFNFRSTVSEDLDDMNNRDLPTRNDIIADHIAGVQLGEAQLMQYIFLKIFCSDAHIKKLGACNCTEQQEGCCCGIIPKTLDMYETKEGTTKGFTAHQNFRTLEEVIGNHDTNGVFKDWGVESATKFAPSPKLVKINPLKLKLEEINKALFTNKETAPKFKTSKKTETSSDAVLKTLGMFVKAIQIREDMCDTTLNGKFTIGVKCTAGAQCVGDNCGCCIPRTYKPEDVVILANASDYRELKTSYIETKGFDNIHALFETGNIQTDSRLEPGKIIVLHKEAICIYPTEHKSGSQDYPEAGKRNTWFDVSMYIGYWPYFPAVVVEATA